MFICSLFDFSYLQAMEIKGLQALLITKPLQFGHLLLYSLSIWTLVTIHVVHCRRHEVSNLQSHQQIGTEQISPLETINDGKSHIYILFAVIIFCILYYMLQNLHNKLI